MVTMNPVEREKRSKFHALPGVSIVFTLTSFLVVAFWVSGDYHHFRSRF